MNRIINWRYEKWDNNEKNNDKKYSEDDISDYISWEIYPEDIELFITVLTPRTIIYKKTKKNNTFSFYILIKARIKIKINLMESPIKPPILKQ